MLFWVTTCGRESTFNNPRLSAIARNASKRKWAFDVINSRPLVGVRGTKLENNGMVPAGVPEIKGAEVAGSGGKTGGIGTVVGDGLMMGRLPTAPLPPPPVRPVAQAEAELEPITSRKRPR